MKLTPSLQDAASWCGGQKMAPRVNKWLPPDGAHD